MSAPKGFSDQKKSRPAEFATVNPVSDQLTGLDINLHGFVRLVASDAVEASSTTSQINATAHVAIRGDVIRITSGALIGKEVVVSSVEANAILLAEILPSAPATLVTFEIHRNAKPGVDSDGRVKVDATVSGIGPSQYIRNGVNTQVSEDTTTPSNSRPLPVKLLDASGAPVVPATAAAQTTGNASLTSIDGKITAVNTGAVVVASSALPSGASTSAAQTTGNTSLASIDGKITAVNTGAVVVASSALPSGAATSAAQATGNTALAAIQTAVEILDNAIAGLEMQVDIVAPLPAGTNNIGDVDVLSLPALPAGTNNIGDVDVLTLPALAAGSNLIGKVSRPGRAKVELIRHVHTTPVTTAAYTQLVASTSAEINSIEIFDSSGEELVLAIGAAASEVNTLYVFPGGNGRVELAIAAGSRISIKAISAATSSGTLLINCLS